MDKAPPDINRNQLNLTGLGFYWDLLTIVQEHFAREEGATLDLQCIYTGPDGKSQHTTYHFECNGNHPDPSGWGSHKELNNV